MADLTLIYLTPNLVPKQWAEYHKKVLLEEIGDTPIITISKEPLDWGTNILQTEYGVKNIYHQILRGAKLATTPYIAIVEDDTLYPREHFINRPPLDTFLYDLNRWILFTWGKPFYHHKPRCANSGMIAPRELAIKALEESPHRVKELGTVDNYKHEEFYSSKPFVCFNHDFSIDSLERRHKKKASYVQALEIPKWGRAKDVRKLFI